MEVQVNMAINIKKIFASDESRSTIMFFSGVLSLLAASAVAVAVWQVWVDIGVMLGPRRRAGVVICSIIGVLLACSSAIWALTVVNRLTGRNLLKCVLGYLLDAVALAVILAFVIIAYYLRNVPSA